MAKSLIPERSLIPSFRLQANSGGMFDTSDYKRDKNLVLFFMTQADRDFLMHLDQAAAVLRQQNAVIAVVCPSCCEVVGALYQAHRLLFAVLSDEKREVLRRFISFAEGEAFAALFITDRHGDVFFEYLAAAAHELPSFEDIARSLEFIESQCPEREGGAL
ncbi:MAG: redoxin domain-containing protein [Candidatus Omnitrophota bacterium]|jgi:peroxiredoxin